MSESVPKSESDDADNRAFHAVVDAETMQTTLALVDALVDECHVYFEDDGVRIPAMDPATVAAVHLTLDGSAFEHYEAEDAHVGVDVARLRDIVGIADRDQLVSLALDPETRKLDIAIGELEYTLALLAPDTVRTPPDRSNLGIESMGGVVADADDFDRSVRAADMVADHIALGIDADDGTFYVEAEGDTDDVSLVLPGDDLVEFTPEDARSLFSVDYLKEINRAMPNGVEVDLQLGTDVPLVMSYEFADGGGAVEYLVSPRIATH